MAWGKKKSGGRKEPQFGLGAALSELRLGPQDRVPGGDDDRAVLVLDRDGERVQALTLEGASLGSFPGLAGPDEAGGARPSRAAGSRERRPPTPG